MATETDVFEVEELGADLRITGYLGHEEVVAIPRRIEGRKVVAIGEYAFSPEAEGLSEGTRQARRQIRSLSMAKGVTVIGKAAFYACEALSYLALPAGLKEMGESAFCGTALEQVTVPAGVERVGDWAFQYCGKLRAVVLSEGVLAVGTGAFCNCPSLSEVQLPSGLKEIGDCAFMETNLATLLLPQGVESIGAGAFADCKRLGEAFLPDSLCFLGRLAFEGCPRLTLCGSEASCAAAYARETGISFAEKCPIEI